jgi:hypothetical protein
LADRDNEGQSGWGDDQIANDTTDPNKHDPACPTYNITNWLNSTNPDIVLLHISTTPSTNPGYLLVSGKSVSYA